jgi:indole-3-glycerol phosphate synthase
VELIGINNRNLEDFSVSLEVTCTLIEQRRSHLAQSNAVIVSESGLYRAADVQLVQRAGAQAVLIGESLIKDTVDQPPYRSEQDRMQAKITALFSPS